MDPWYTNRLLWWYTFQLLLFKLITIGETLSHLLGM